MKKSFLAILLALVMCFGVFALTACEPDNPTPPGPGGDANVPVADGKVTLYFTMADDSIELPEYASVWFTGGQLNFATGTNAIEFKNVEGTKLYYVQITYSDAPEGLEKAEQVNDYQLVLGYNSKSGLPEDKQGLAWIEDYKSDQCFEYKDMTNPKFEYDGKAQKVDLGTHKWSNEIAKPERVAKTSLRITFSEALGEKAEVYIIGAFNNWEATNAKATASADRTYYSIDLKDMLCTTYEYKILVFKDTDDVQMKDADGKDLGIWNRTSKANPKESAHIEIADNGGANLKVAIAKMDNGSYIDLCGTVSEEMDGVKKSGLDLSKAFKDQNKDNDGNLVDSYTWKLQLGPSHNLKVTFKTALAEGSKVYVLGDMNNWGNTEGWSITEAQMTLDADRKVATLGVSAITGTEWNFKVIVVKPGVEIKVTNDVWSNENPVGGSANQKITVGPRGDMDLFKEAQDDPSAVATVDVTLTVKFSAALTGKHVFVAGAFTNWDKNAVEMKSTDGINYTAEIKGIKVGENEVKIVVCDTDAFTWDGTGFPAQGNTKITVSAEGGTIAVFAEALEMPAGK